MTEEALQLILERAGANIFHKFDNDGLAAPLLLTQAEYSLHSLEEHMDTPARVKQVVNLTSPQAFAAYVKRFRDESTAVFVGKDSFTAILDYHLDPTHPSWCTHKAVYRPEHSLAWKAWAAQNEKQMTQLDFAFFLEKRLDEILRPAPADVMGAILKFKQTANHTLQSEQDLDTGAVRFQFVKDTKNTNVSFPHDITLKLRVYDHHDAIEVPLYVRYRSNEGRLVIWYQFKQEPTDVVRKHFETISEGIRSSLEGIPFFEGSPA